jgi:Flp pilus assembly protein TadG
VPCKVRLLTYARMSRIFPSRWAPRTRLWRRRSHDARRGQSLVEFGLVLPFVLLTFMAILEFGWYAAVAAATASASREAAHYGSTVGTDGSINPGPHYIDCAGIRAAARSTTGPLITLTDAQIAITYEGGAIPCASGASRPAAADIDRFDRVVVTVTVNYAPLTPIFPTFVPGPYDIVSVDRRSIVKP